MKNPANYLVENGRDRGSLLVPCLLSFLLWMGWEEARAHEGPSEVVQQLSRTMEQGGVTSDLLMRRATEYRVLGQVEDAVKDLRAVLALDSDSREARTELGRIYMAQGRDKEALTVINEALDGLNEGADRARLLMVRAEIYRMEGRYTEALGDCDRAFELGDPIMEWYLARSRLHNQLEMHVESCRALGQGWEKYGSHVLHEEWVEALIRAGRYEQALAEIEPQMAASRWRSSWLLRRAQARQGRKDGAGARKDLDEAVVEINQRLHPVKPDLSLLADRGLAWALLGEKDLARADLEAAHQGGASSWMVERLERVLGSQPPNLQ